MSGSKLFSVPNEQPWCYPQNLSMLGSSDNFVTSPHVRHVNTNTFENPGNRLTAPQCAHFSLVTSSVLSISSNVRCRSAAVTVRTKTAHSLHVRKTTSAS